ncbi:MAG: phage major capsid protein [Mogibacterium sp.]|nr:phage major capsid protein [Mogibacterium sp.]
MKLRALMLRKNLDDKRKALEAERAKDAEFEQREADLMASIEEASTDEEKTVVREAVDAFETEKAEHDKAVTDLDEEVRDLEAKLDEVERDQDAAAPAEPEAAPAEPEARSKRKESKAMNMRTRKVFGHMTREEREEMIQRSDVQEFLTEVRRGISEKRAITNVGLLIPEVVLPVLRENIIEYSKLYKYVRVVAVSGEGRQPVMGTIPEAVWTDCCANLNELDLGFNDTEINCWKVAGYYAICNANIEDSDIDLLAEIVVALGASIGLALDKAILYGKGTRMPLGVVSSLAQESKPADYPETAREWVDLHATNMIKINSASMSATELFAAIVTAFGNAKGKYSRGEKVFVMSEKTYTALAAKAISVDANGNIVTGVLDRMPVIGGAIEVLDFVPDNDIIGGFFDLYLLGERAGAKFATSEHVRFLQDQTVMKGTARYDGKPSIREAFVAINISNTTPTSDVPFAPDDANADPESE